MGTKLLPILAISCTLLWLCAAQKLPRVTPLLQNGAAADGTASTLTSAPGDAKGSGCSEGPT